MKLIECVPNFSEGRDRAVIDAITAEISATEGAVLLDVDPGEATNRTVVTLAGPPEAAEEAAFREGFIDADQLRHLAEAEAFSGDLAKSGYGERLLRFLDFETE